MNTDSIVKTQFFRAAIHNFYPKVYEKVYAKSKQMISNLLNVMNNFISY